MEIKKNISLIVGLAIPVLMVVAIAASIYLPALFVKAEHNFLYTMDNDYPTYHMSSGEDVVEKYMFSVENNKLTVAINRIDVNSENKNQRLRPYLSDKPTLYIYDVTSHKSTKISIEEAEQLRLDPTKKSPDGFEITHGGNNYDMFPFFFGGSSYGNYYLQKDAYSKKLDLERDSRGYRYDFNFIGWIIN